MEKYIFFLILPVFLVPQAIAGLEETTLFHAKETSKKSIDIPRIKQDPRMTEVQTLLDNTYNKNTLSIYVENLKTHQTASINADAPMYAASVGKLGVLYYTQTLLDAQKIQPETTITYTTENVVYPGAYQLSGTGILPKKPNNKQYDVKTLVRSVTHDSDNVGADLLGALTGKYDQKFQTAISAVTGKKWDITYESITAKQAGQVMSALYRKSGFVLDSMKDTAFDKQRIPRDLPVPVAHKIGDADDFRHDVAVVYGETPYVISIFTKDSTYDTISEISNQVYKILQ